MMDLLKSIRKLNRLGGTDLAEPFAGGAGAALGLLYSGETRSIHLNDADPSIFDFWWTLTHKSKEFIDLIKTTPLSIDEWHKQRDVYRCKTKTSRLQRGFSAFYLNRCNRSGIIMNGGPIGGYSQEGAWKIDVRFNRPNLATRCAKVAEYRDRIKVTNLDGIDFIRSLDSEKTTFFIDPPYYVKGPKLYLNHLSHEYHENLSDVLRRLETSSWILTYDDCSEIRDLYSSWAHIRPFTLSYAAAEKRKGNELLITPKWMILPSSQSSAAISLAT